LHLHLQKISLWDLYRYQYRSRGREKQL